MKNKFIYPVIIFSLIFTIYADKPMELQPIPEQQFPFKEMLKRLLENQTPNYLIFFKIADFYYYGRKDIPVNKSRARTYYQKALTDAQSAISLNSDNLLAQYILGVSADKLIHASIDGISLIKESADQGLAEAQADMAFRHMKGKGVPVDFDSSFKYAKLAANQNNLFGKAILGAYLMNVKKDSSAGLKLIRESAEGGNAGGQYMLFRCLYYKKPRTEKDEELALKLLKLSADQGLPDAVSKLRIFEQRNNKNNDKSD